MMALMRQPAPLGTVPVSRLIEEIQERHKDDPALDSMPEPENLLRVIAFVHRQLTHFDKLAHLAPERRRELQYEEIKAALLLTRVARQEIDRLELGLLRAGQTANMPARQLGEPLGIRSRQGPRDRITALSKKVRAAQLHVPTNALDERGSLPPSSAPLLRTAHALVDNWDDLLTDAEIDDWRDGLSDVLHDYRGTRLEDASIATQLRLAVEEITELASSRNLPPARTPQASAVLAEVRLLTTRHTGSSDGSPS